MHRRVAGPPGRATVRRAADILRAWARDPAMSDVVQAARVKDVDGGLLSGPRDALTIGLVLVVAVRVGLAPSTPPRSSEERAVVS